MWDESRPPRRAALSADLESLFGQSRQIWTDSTERRLAVQEIVNAAAQRDSLRLRDNLTRIDTAVTDALDLLGLPRGPIKAVEPVVARRYAGRKHPDCTLEINVEVVQASSTLERGPDTTLRIWVHESIHGRQPYAPDHRAEYGRWGGYEEGLAEGLARIVVRGRAGLDPIEVDDFDSFIAAFQTLSEYMQIEYEELLRALWRQPAGRVRGFLVEAVDSLRQARSLPTLSATERANIARTADRAFSLSNLGRRADRSVMLALWRGPVR